MSGRFRQHHYRAGGALGDVRCSQDGAGHALHLGCCLGLATGAVACCCWHRRTVNLADVLRIVVVVGTVVGTAGRVAVDAPGVAQVRSGALERGCADHGANRGGRKR